MPSLHDDRGHWGSGARWLHLANNAANGGGARATLYRAKQNLQQPNLVDEPMGTTTTARPAPDESSSSSPNEMDDNKTANDQSIVDDQSSSAPLNARNKPGVVDGGAALLNSKRNLISSFGGNFDPSSSSAQQPVNHQASSQQQSVASKTHVTVHQVPLNTFTYRLQLSIAHMQPDDYGEYTCVSINNMGTSESTIMVTSKFTSAASTRDHCL